ncbi:MAG: hypothetical protein ACKOJB_02830 [Chthoniobacterales bacterium]
MPLIEYGGSLGMSKRRRKGRLLKLLRVAVVAVLAFAVLGALGYWFVRGWRARDLALKSRANLESANYRMAWMQMHSARDLRPDDPEVLRTAAIVGEAFGMKECLESWRQLAAKQKLAPEDEELRARAAIRFGEGAQLEESLAALDSAGKQGAAAQIRAAE